MNRLQETRKAPMRLISWMGSNWGIALTGIAIGGFGALLSSFSGSKNTGFCITGFLGDLILAIFPSQNTHACFCSLQKEAGVQALLPADFIRPEYLGLVLGPFIASITFREFHARAGSSTIIRFILGMCGLLGILAFWACPVRTLLRLGGGDLSALIGLAGLTGGIGIGTIMIRAGFELGKPKDSPLALGLMMPVVMLGLLTWVIFARSDNPLPRAPLGLALGAGLTVGFLAQRSRFCIMSSIRNVFLMRSWVPLLAVGSVVASALVVNAFLGQVQWGFTGQPFAHSNIFWGVLGMVVGGLAFTLAGACPTRQLFLSGEGNIDSVVFMLGMLTATWIAQQLGFTVAPDTVILDNVFVGGPNMAGMIAVIISLLVCLIIGISMRKPRSTSG
jgi:hypothetical protein